LFWSAFIRGLNELIDGIFEIFLTAARVRVHFALLQHVGFQVLETCVAGFNLRTDAAVPRSIALFDEVGQVNQPKTRPNTSCAPSRSVVLAGSTPKEWRSMPKDARSTMIGSCSADRGRR
jgi:hypothetical protein